MQLFKIGGSINEVVLFFSLGCYFIWTFFRNIVINIIYNQTQRYINIFFILYFIPLFVISCFNLKETNIDNNFSTLLV